MKKPKKKRTKKEVSYTTLLALLIKIREMKTNGTMVEVYP